MMAEDSDYAEIQQTLEQAQMELGVAISSLASSVLEDEDVLNENRDGMKAEFSGNTNACINNGSTDTVDFLSIFAEHGLVLDDPSDQALHGQSSPCSRGSGSPRATPERPLTLSRPVQVPSCCNFKRQPWRLYVHGDYSYKSNQCPGMDTTLDDSYKQDLENIMDELDPKRGKVFTLRETKSAMKTDCQNGQHINKVLDKVNKNLSDFKEIKDAYKKSPKRTSSVDNRNNKMLEESERTLSNLRTDLYIDEDSISLNNNKQYNRNATEARRNSTERNDLTNDNKSLSACNKQVMLKRCVSENNSERCRNNDDIKEKVLLNSVLCSRIGKNRQNNDGMPQKTGSNHQPASELSTQRQANISRDMNQNMGDFSQNNDSSLIKTKIENLSNARVNNKGRSLPTVPLNGEASNKSFISKSEFDEDVNLRAVNSNMNKQISPLADGNKKSLRSLGKPIFHVPPPPPLEDIPDDSTKSEKAKNEWLETNRKRSKSVQKTDIEFQDLRRSRTVSPGERIVSQVTRSTQTKRRSEQEEREVASKTEEDLSRCLQEETEIFKESQKDDDKNRRDSKTLLDFPSKDSATSTDGSSAKLSTAIENSQRCITAPPVLSKKSTLTQEGASVDYSVSQVHKRQTEENYLSKTDVIRQDRSPRKLPLTPADIDKNNKNKMKINSDERAEILTNSDTKDTTILNGNEQSANLLLCKDKSVADITQEKDDQSKNSELLRSNKSNSSSTSSSSSLLDSMHKKFYPDQYKCPREQKTRSAEVIAEVSNSIKNTVRSATLPHSKTKDISESGNTKTDSCKISPKLDPLQEVTTEECAASTQKSSIVRKENNSTDPKTNDQKVKEPVKRSVSLSKPVLLTDMKEKRSLSKSPTKGPFSSFFSRSSPFSSKKSGRESKNIKVENNSDRKSKSPTPRSLSAQGGCLDDESTATSGGISGSLRNTRLFSSFSSSHKATRLTFDRTKSNSLKISSPIPVSTRIIDSNQATASNSNSPAKITEEKKGSKFNKREVSKSQNINSKVSRSKSMLTNSSQPLDQVEEPADCKNNCIKNGTNITNIISSISNTNSIDSLKRVVDSNSLTSLHGTRQAEVVPVSPSSGYSEISPSLSFSTSSTLSPESGVEHRTSSSGILSEGSASLTRPSPDHTAGTDCLRAECVELGSEKENLALDTSNTSNDVKKAKLLELCRWLMAAGFPQYVQLYKDDRFPISLNSIEEDHDFLDPDLLKSLKRRMSTLNKLADANIQLPKNRQTLKHTISGPHTSEVYALSNRWRFDQLSQQWLWVSSSSSSKQPLRVNTNLSSTSLNDSTSPSPTSIQRGLTHSKGPVGIELSPGGDGGGEEVTSARLTSGYASESSPQSVTSRHSRTHSDEAREKVNSKDRIRFSELSPPTINGRRMNEAGSISSVGSDTLFEDNPPSSSPSLSEILDGCSDSGSLLIRASSRTSSDGISDCGAQGEGQTNGRRSNVSQESDSKPHDYKCQKSVNAINRAVSVSERRHEIKNGLDNENKHLSKRRSSNPNSINGSFISNNKDIMSDISVNKSGNPSEGSLSWTELLQRRREQHGKKQEGGAGGGGNFLQPVDEGATNPEFKRHSFYDNLSPTELNSMSADVQRELDMILTDLYYNISGAESNENKQVTKQPSIMRNGGCHDTHQCRKKCQTLPPGRTLTESADYSSSSSSCMRASPRTYSRHISIDTFSSTRPRREIGGSTHSSFRSHTGRDDFAEEGQSRHRCDQRHNSFGGGKVPTSGRGSLGCGCHASQDDYPTEKSEDWNLCQSSDDATEHLQLSSLYAKQLTALRKLSLLKLSALFDAHSSDFNMDSVISSPRNLSNQIRNFPDSSNIKKIFGVSLQSLLERDKRSIPHSISQAVEYLRKNGLESVGIFRKSGIQSRIQKLQDDMDNDVAMDISCVDVYDVADALKRYFRELPECLLTDHLSSLFLTIFISVPEELHTSAVCQAVLLLPDSHRQALQFLLSFLHDVSEQSAENQMTASNLAVCFLPSFFSPPSMTSGGVGHITEPVKKSEHKPEPLWDYKAALACVTCLICQAKQIFTVPKESLSVVNASEYTSNQELLDILGHARDGLRMSHIASYIQFCLDMSLTEQGDWIMQNTRDRGVTLCVKDVHDNECMRTWRCVTEVQADPASVLERLRGERHLWIGGLSRWHVVERLGGNCDVLYSLTNIPGNGATEQREFCEFRCWRSDLPRGACALVSATTEHHSLVHPPCWRRGEVLGSHAYIESCGPGASRLVLVSRVDLRGHSVDWYTAVYGSMLVDDVIRLRESFQ